MKYLLEAFIKDKNLWLIDVWNAREAIGNEEQDPEILHNITQQEAMRNFLEADIQPAQVASLSEITGVKRKQQQLSNFFLQKFS